MRLINFFAQYETKYKNLWLVIQTAIYFLVCMCICWYVLVSVHFHLVNDVGQDSVTAQTSPAGAVNETTLTQPSQHKLPSRVSSAHMRQLSKFTIPRGQLQLVETLGQG